MRGTREIKNWIKRMVSRHGKKNGGLKSFCFDNPRMELKDANSKRNDQHIKAHADWKSES